MLHATNTADFADIVGLGQSDIFHDTALRRINDAMADFKRLTITVPIIVLILYSKVLTSQTQF